MGNEFSPKPTVVKQLDSGIRELTLIQPFPPLSRMGQVSSWPCSYLCPTFMEKSCHSFAFFVEIMPLSNSDSMACFKKYFWFPTLWPLYLLIVMRYLEWPQNNQTEGSPGQSSLFMLIAYLQIPRPWTKYHVWSLDVQKLHGSLSGLVCVQVTRCWTWGSPTQLQAWEAVIWWTESIHCYLNSHGL